MCAADGHRTERRRCHECPTRLFAREWLSFTTVAVDLTSWIGVQVTVARQYRTLTGFAFMPWHPGQWGTTAGDDPNWHPTGLQAAARKESGSAVGHQLCTGSAVAKLQHLTFGGKVRT